MAAYRAGSPVGARFSAAVEAARGHEAAAVGFSNGAVISSPCRQARRHLSCHHHAVALAALDASFHATSRGHLRGSAYLGDELATSRAYRREAPDAQARLLLHEFLVTAECRRYCERGQMAED